MFFGIILIWKWFSGDLSIRHSGQNLSAVGSTDCIHPGNHDASGAPLGLSHKLLPGCERCPTWEGRWAAYSIQDRAASRLTAHQSSGQHCPQVRTQAVTHLGLYQSMWAPCPRLCCAVSPRFGSGSSRVCSKLLAVYTFPCFLLSVTFLPAPDHLHSCSSLALLQNWAVSQKEPSSLRLQTLE